MAKIQRKAREGRYPTSVWFDEETKSALARLVERSGEKKSDVIRTLIHAADTNEREGEVRRLVSELHAIVM